MKTMKLLFPGLVVCALLSGCTTIVSRAPRTVIVTEDLRFTCHRPFPRAWASTNEATELETTLPAGRYVLESVGGPWAFFAAPGGLVSIGKPGEGPEEVRGGIQFDRRSGSIYVRREVDDSSSPPPHANAAGGSGHGGGGGGAWPSNGPKSELVGEIPRDLLPKLAIEG